MLNRILQKLSPAGCGMALKVPTCVTCVGPPAWCILSRIGAGLKPTRDGVFGPLKGGLAAREDQGCNSSH